MASREYLKKIKHPHWRNPGIYPSGSHQELGLDSDDLEKYSLGNWNSILKYNRLFPSYFDNSFKSLRDSSYSLLASSNSTSNSLISFSFSKLTNKKTIPINIHMIIWNTLFSLMLLIRVFRACISFIQ